MTDIQRDLTWLTSLLWEAEDVMIYLCCWFSVLCSEVCSKCCSCFSELMPEFYVPFPHISPHSSSGLFCWVWRFHTSAPRLCLQITLLPLGLLFSLSFICTSDSHLGLALYLKKLRVLVIFYNDAQGRELYGGSRNINILPIQGS